ncbi:MAG: DUF1576 domain-containing protein [Peptostreptococcaceae bacterium]|nr:DUF1576 domain-containing protein [Peptostreptococcaceae bacterium]
MVTFHEIFSKEKNVLHKNDQFVVLLILPLAMIVLAFTYDNPVAVIRGINKIRLSNDVLLTDYMLLGGMGSALFNSAVVTLINLWLIYRLELKPNGIIISSLFLISGFSFIGKNMFNIWPFYLGGWLYAQVHKIEFKNVFIICMLSTALSPLISVLVLSLRYDLTVSLFLTIIIGAFLGYVMPAVSSQVLLAHSGYSIYNMGFAGGLMGILVFSILKALKIPVQTNLIVSASSDDRLNWFFTLYFILLILYGFFTNGRSFSGYSKLLSRSGRLVTDMTRLDGFSLSTINMGIMGLISILYVLLMGGVINGPTIAGILTVSGFAAFGKHPRNCLSILAGVALSAKILSMDIASTQVIIAGLFATTLAPIVGEYGFSYGFVLGFLHLVMTFNIGALHGGVFLYNNGLSGGLVATLFVPMLDALKKEKQDAI